MALNTVSSKLRAYARFQLIAAVILVLHAVAFGQTSSNAARPDRGTRPNGTYSFSDIENISLTNGNVNLAIPLASLPPIAGGKLGLTLNANYNSKMWDVKRQEVETDGFPSGVRYDKDILQDSFSSGWRIGAAYHIVWQSFTAFEYGWMGPQINDVDEVFFQNPYNHPSNWFKCYLITPDGSTHELRPVDRTPYQGGRTFLWSYYNDTPFKLNTSMRYYTSDGSFIWAKINPDSSNIKWEVYMPDGSHIVQHGSFQRIKDPEGNSIKLSSVESFPGEITGFIQDENATGGLRQIKNATSALNNTHKIIYQTVNGVEEVIDIVWATVEVVGKTYVAQDHFSQTNNLCTQVNLLEFLSFQVVREIILPQTEPNVPRRKFRFTYNCEATQPVPGLVYWECEDFNNQHPVPTSSWGWGSISQMIMPSGAQVNYTYAADNIHFLQELDEAPADKIATKTVVHDGVSDTWTYGLNEISCGVTGPDGSNITEFFYATSPAYASAYGGAPGLGSLVYKSVRKVNNQPQVTVEKHWTRLLFAGGNDTQPGTLFATPFNPVVDTEYTTVHDPAGNPIKMSAKTFQYDFNGNLKEERCYDWFNPNLVTRDPGNVNLPMGVPGSATLLRVTTNSFHNQADGSSSANVYAKRLMVTPPTPYILNAVKETNVGNGVITLSKSRFHYDNQNFSVAPTKGNLTKEQHDKDGVWIEVNHTYDPKGNRVSTTDPRGNITRFFYDQQTFAQPTSIVVDPNNQAFGDEHTTLISYDFYTGLVTRETNPNGQVTTTDYKNQKFKDIGIIKEDPYGRPGVVTSPVVTVNINGVPSSQKGTAVNRYHDAARQAEVWSDLNAEGDAKLRTRTSVDELGRAIRTESSEDGSTYTIKTETAYEQMGRITYNSNPLRLNVSSPTDGWTRTKHDDMGRVVEVATFNGATKPSATATNWNGRVTTDYSGNEVTVTDQDGKKRRSVADGVGRLAKVYEDPTGLNYETNYTYDARGNITQVNQGAQVRQFIYDTLSRLRIAKHPEQGMADTTYTYDDASNLTLKNNPNGTSVSFTYDGLNRTLTKTLSTGGIWNYTYDTLTNGKGRLSQVVKQGSTDGNYYDGYDAMGRVTASRQVTDSNSYAMSYGYDLAGNMTRQVYPSGKEYRTTFDNAGRISTVKRYVSGSFEKTYAEQFTYSPHGAITEMRLSNNILKETAVYNPRLQPTQVELRRVAANELILGLDYDYGSTNNNGNLRAQTIRINSQGVMTTINQSYGYDGLNRLSTATEAGAWSQTYGHDRFGNRWVSAGYVPNVVLTPQTQSAFNAANNRLVASGYDASGNQTADAMGRTFGYDSENHQTSFNGGATAYVYDADGRRVKKAAGSAATIFVYNAGGQLVAEYKSDPVPPPAGGGGTSYLTSDHLGSTRVVAKADGTVKARYDYLPYGEELAAGIGSRMVAMGYSAADSTNQKFTSKERDSESGLDYFGARYYSSAQGRFTGVDQGPPEPADPRTWNRYQYTRNNPLYYTDDDGNSDKPAKAKHVNNALATDPTLLEVIKASNNFSQQAFEDSFNRGELKGNLTSPGGNTLRGLAGEAIVIDALRKSFSATPDVPSFVRSQPLSLAGLRPDILAAHSPVAADSSVVNHVLTNVITDASGRTGMVQLPKQTISVFYEVKSGFSPNYLQKGANQVSALAGALRATGGLGAAVLTVDKGAWTKLSPERRQEIYNQVSKAGGFIQIWDGLAAQAAKRAREVVKETKKREQEAQ